MLKGRLWGRTTTDVQDARTKCEDQDYILAGITPDNGAETVIGLFGPAMWGDNEGTERLYIAFADGDQVFLPWPRSKADLIQIFAKLVEDDLKDAGK